MAGGLDNNVAAFVICQLTNDIIVFSSFKAMAMFLEDLRLCRSMLSPSATVSITSLYFIRNGTV